jgi:hypothetical protein
MSPIEFCRVILLTEWIGQRTVFSSWLGLVCGVGGIFYGLRAKTFTAFGRFSRKEPEVFAPSWVYRAWVVVICGAAAITSLVFIARNW